MGACAGSRDSKNRNSADLTTTDAEQNNLHPKEQSILKLIHADLSSRIPQKSLNIVNFLLFFHKNGFWGIRLFHQFDYGDSNLITETEFLNSISKIFKTDEDKRIKLLFKFFASSSSPNRIRRKVSTLAEEKRNLESGREKGVKCEDFLRMLYNYPKEGLKQILNDQDFFEAEIKNFLQISDKRQGLNQYFSPQRAICKSMSMVYRIHQNSDEQEDQPQNSRSQVQESMMGKDILKQIKHRSADQTILKLRDGQETIEVKTTNIHLLVKKFARNLYKSQGINPRTGELSLEQFSDWIKRHKTLYKNYYDGFHNDIWEIDPNTGKPQYLSESTEMQGTAHYQFGKSNINVYLRLKRSVLVVCKGNKLTENPLQIICLDGLEVASKFQDSSGWGVEITHRQGVYPIKRFYFKNEQILQQWMDVFKYFNGGSIESQYILGRKLGTGKFSIVYEAQSKISKEMTAVKVIDYQQLDEDARKMIEQVFLHINRYRHESSVMKIMSHPLLVQFQNCIQTKTHLYIVTELCPGRDLYELVMEQKYLSEKDAALIIQQIIVGVKYMNSLGLIHRDLKPQNIMEKKVETVKIIDFGFANYLAAFKDMSPEDVLAGTPNYIAPELLRAEPISFKIDNFSIGSILYFMLCGVPPFNSRNLTDIFEKTLNGTYDFKAHQWEQVSSSAKDLINWLLNTDPIKRITLEKALKHPWFKQIKQKNSASKIY